MSKKSVQPGEGWYEDANRSGTERYWDGAGWTEQTRPIGSPPPPRTESDEEGLTPKQKLGLVGAGIFALIVVAAGTAGQTPTATAPTPTQAVDQESSDEPEVPENLAMVEETTTTEAATTTTLPPTPLEAFEAELADQSDRVVEVYYGEEIGFLRAEIYMDLLGFWVDTEVYVQIKDVLKIVAESELEVQNFDLAIHMEFVDQLGNSEEAPALRASWTGETIGNINFPNFLHDNVLAIGELTYIHAALADDLAD